MLVPRPDILKAFHEFFQKKIAITKGLGDELNGNN